jgi:ribonuclease P protein component
VENKRLAHSLTRRADFLRLKERGRSFHVNQWLLVNFEATERGHLRGGWTIPAYVGNAVIRNRLRRWGREFLRARRSEFAGVDVNFVFKRRDKALFRTLTHAEFTDAMEKMVVKLSRNLE